MDKEKVHEIMSKILSYWDDVHGLENCSMEVVEGLFMILSLSPNDDGFMRVSLFEEQEKTYLVPFEEMILFGFKGVEVKNYEPTRKSD